LRAGLARFFSTLIDGPCWTGFAFKSSFIPIVGSQTTQALFPIEKWLFLRADTLIHPFFFHKHLFFNTRNAFVYFVQVGLTFPATST
jgi:hypothetical protein